MSALRSDDIEIAFCGGTSLSKAHNLIERMSEDVDFKLDVRDKGLSKNQRRGLLSVYRDNAVSELRKLGYEIEAKHIKSRDANSYMQIRLPYATSFTQLAAIRPDVQIELNASSPRVATVTREVQTLVSPELSLSRSGLVRCLDVSETMAEKLVAFTRRVSQFLCGKIVGISTSRWSVTCTMFISCRGAASSKTRSYPGLPAKYQRTTQSSLQSSTLSMSPIRLARRSALLMLLRRIRVLRIGTSSSSMS